MNTTKSDPEPLAYTIPAFCKAVGISRTSVYELIRTGELETVKVAGRRLVPRRSAEKLLAKERGLAS